MGIAEERGPTDDAPDANRRPDAIEVGSQKRSPEQELRDPESDLCGRKVTPRE